ncbi:MAG TPA: GNAT family protein [Thiolinea sp.]|nr:GNAT family protein [Thiolinea sp.]
MQTPQVPNASVYLNELGQEIGFPVPHWQACPTPQGIQLAGQYCTLEHLTMQHAADLFTAYVADRENRIWTYLPYGPFADLASFSAWLSKQAVSTDPLFYSVLDKTGKAVGVASYLRLDPANGVIEVGHINFSPALQRTQASTEAMYLMMRHVFDDLGYRRYEWKCNALNAPSCQAAKRLGFSFEGIFRQAAIVKGRNRDTAWFSILDSEWPALKQRFEAWLAASNFDAQGQQLKALEQS